jgi:hypothetical protein
MMSLTHPPRHAGSYGSGAGSFGARSLSIAEDSEELEHDAALLLMCAAAARAQSAPSSAFRAVPQFDRRASAASLDDEPSEDGREDSPSAFTPRGASPTCTALTLGAGTGPEVEEDETHGMDMDVADKLTSAMGATHMGAAPAFVLPLSVQ